MIKPFFNAYAPIMLILGTFATEVIASREAEESTYYTGDIHVGS